MARNRELSNACDSADCLLEKLNLLYRVASDTLPQAAIVLLDQTREVQRELAVKLLHLRQHYHACSMAEAEKAAIAADKAGA